MPADPAPSITTVWLRSRDPVAAAPANRRPGRRQRPWMSSLKLAADRGSAPGSAGRAGGRSRPIAAGHPAARRARPDEPVDEVVVVGADIRCAASRGTWGRRGVRHCRCRRPGAPAGCAQDRCHPHRVQRQLADRYAHAADALIARPRVRWPSVTTMTSTSRLGRLRTISPMRSRSG